MTNFFGKYKGEMLYTLSNYTTPLVTMITNIVAAAFLQPAELGTISSVLIVLPYLAFLQLGVFNGLNRNLAYYKAQGNDAKVQAMVNASHTVAGLNALIGLGVGLGYMFYYLLSGASTIYLFSALLLLVNLIFNPFVVHYETTFRSSQNFMRLGKITLIENGIYAVANLLPIIIGYFGKIIANGLRVLSRFWFRWREQPHTANGRGKKEDVLELMKVGAPLMFGAYLMGLILVSDQTMIVTFLGAEKLGLYSLSVFLMTAMVIIPTSLNTLLYPKAAAQYGRNNDAAALRSFFWKALGINTLVIVPLCLLIYFLIPPLTHLFLPKYAAGIAAAQINLFTCLTFVSNGPSVIIGVLRKNTPLLAAYGVTLLLIWVAGFVYKDHLQQIEHVAWFRFFLSAFLSAFTLVYTFILTAPNSKHAKNSV
jgi:O-antigen/teichoic acid export membrane protein